MHRQNIYKHRYIQTLYSHKPELKSYLWHFDRKLFWGHINAKKTPDRQSIASDLFQCFCFTKCRLDLTTEDIKLALNDMTRSVAHSSNKLTLQQCTWKYLDIFGRFMLFATWHYANKFWSLFIINMIIHILICIGLMVEDIELIWFISGMVF